MQNVTSEKTKRSIKRVRRDATAEQIALTVPQAAKIVGKSERAIWLDIYRGRFPFRRQGKRRIVILRDELLEFLKSLPGISAEAAAEKVRDAHSR
ncbi:MAG TPA: helix-turn-helix domain-containing protein [Candidatus Binatia bacterium]|nr:helix-turn-helix domain-containing protein [Candidatus Binatia bacterium]